MCDSSRRNVCVSPKEADTVCWTLEVPCLNPVGGNSHRLAPLHPEFEHVQVCGGLGIPDDRANACLSHVDTPMGRSEL